MLMNYARVCNPYSGFFAPVNGTSATECAEKALFSGLSRHVLHYGLGIKDGRKIDVGCGSGALTIACARRNPQAQMIGVDRWGKEYDFSRKLCEANAEAEGVQNVSFQNGDARHLPFPDDHINKLVNFGTYDSRLV